MTMTTLYRATSRDEYEIEAGTCWTEDRAVAVAYQDNPGFGGAILRAVIADTSDVIDLTDAADIHNALAEVLPDYDAEAERGRNVRYPWIPELGGGEVFEALAERATWLRFTDDYPEGAVTMLALRDVNVDEAE